VVKEIENGNIFHSSMEWITITVNTVGAMGKGLALEAKTKYPKLEKAYRYSLEKGSLAIGKPCKVMLIERSFMMFATKDHWKDPSRIEYIEWGLQWLSGLPISSIAIPPLGCGLGGLKWNDVYPLIKEYTSQIPQVEIYLPRRRK